MAALHRELEPAHAGINGELEARIGLLTRELNEAFERETATDELLHVIASSPTDIKPVLDAVAASAARLCDAYDVIIRLKKDDMLHLGAHSARSPSMRRRGR